MKRALQSLKSPVVEPPRTLDTPDLPREFGPWLSAVSAARYLDFAGKCPVDAFRMWARRHHVAVAHRGRRVLYARSDLLKAIGAHRRSV